MPVDCATTQVAQIAVVVLLRGTKPSTDVFYALGDPDCKVYLVYDDMFVISTDYSSGLIMKTRDGLTGFPMYQNSDLSQLKFDIKVARSTSLTY